MPLATSPALVARDGRCGSRETRPAGLGGAPAELLRLFEEAISSGMGLGFRDRGREGRASVRRIEPHGLLSNAPVWYILARDVDKDVTRIYRMDRASAPSLLRGLRFTPDPRVARALLSQGVRCEPLLS